MVLDEAELASARRDVAAMRGRLHPAGNDADVRQDRLLRVRGGGVEMPGSASLASRSDVVVEGAEERREGEAGSGSTVSGSTVLGSYGLFQWFVGGKGAQEEEEDRRPVSSGPGLTACIDFLRGVTYELERHGYVASHSHRVPRTLQLAEYAGQGAHYVAHLDTCLASIWEMGVSRYFEAVDERGRVITCILYLNRSDWDVVGRCKRDPSFESAVLSNLEPEGAYIAFNLNLTF